MQEIKERCFKTNGSPHRCAHRFAMTFKGRTAEQRMSLRGATKARRGNPYSCAGTKVLAETLLSQQQTALIEQGLDLDSQYQLSHADQAQFAAETANNAVLDQSIGELARLVEQEKLTSVATDGMLSLADKGAQPSHVHQNSFPFNQAYVEEVLSKKSPVEIPASATIKQEQKNGYEQVKYMWRNGEYTYTSRWHTRTPNAPKEQAESWVVQRDKPGVGYGSNVRPATHEILVDIDYWISRKEWQMAIYARKNGTATKEQKEMLDHGHWASKE